MRRLMMLILMAYLGGVVGGWYVLWPRDCSTDAECRATPPCMLTPGCDGGPEHQPWPWLP
jgi:hypothetical protein